MEFCSLMAKLQGQAGLTANPQNISNTAWAFATAEQRAPELGAVEGAVAYDGIDSIRHLTNFGRSVLGCIEAYDSETRRIFQHFSKSTRCAFLCTTRNSIFCKKNRLFFLQILLFIAVKPDFMTNFLTNFDEILTNFDEILTNGDEF